MPQLYIETEPYEAGFAKYYDEVIRPHLARLADQRPALKKELTRRRVIGGLGVVASLGAGGAYWAHDPPPAQGEPFKFWPMAVGMVAIGGAILSWHTMSTPAARYRAMGKRAIVADVLRFFGADYCDTAEALLNNKKLIGDTRLFPDFSQLEVEDSVTKSFDGHIYSAAELKLFGETRIIGSVSIPKTVFSGLVIEAPINDLPPLNEPVRIHPKRFSFLDKSVKRDDVPITHRGYAESPKQFDQYLNDKYMEIFKWISDEFGEENVGLSFFQNKLYIKIQQTPNFFESLTCIKTTPSVSEVKALVKDGHMITDLLQRLHAKTVA